MPPIRKQDYQTIEQLQADFGITDYERNYFEAVESDLLGATTPEEAREYLARIGLETKDYLDIMNSYALSHQQRACIIIATGDTPRLAWLINKNLRNIDALDGVSTILGDSMMQPEMIVEALRKRLATLI